MKNIGGNVEATLQVKKITKNDIGEGVENWETRRSLIGFLDYITGTAEYANYNAKIQESTHVFICDYQNIEYEEAEIRLMILNKPYEVELIDDPMFLHKHIEIYLKYVGD